MANNFDANNTDRTLLRCIVCENVIPDAAWFARFKLGDVRVAACSPNCMEKFFDNQRECAAKVGVTLMADPPKTY
jgi:hypothetical protein